MLINNPEALKSWLVIVLEPLCDADSSALARYVLALLKKDKPEKELKRVMIEQLDVFLGEETKPFVERLFTAIGTEEYLSDSALAAAAAADAAKLADTSAGDAVAEVEVEGGDILELATATELELLADVPAASSSSSSADKLQASAGVDLQLPKTKDNQTNNGSSGLKSSSDAAVASSTASSSAASAAHHNAFKSSEASSTSAAGNHIRRSISPLPAASSNAATIAGRTSNVATTLADKENLPRESRRRRASLRSRSRSPRSRSRSNERLSRRSRSRDRRASEREKSQRQFRNKSPPPPPTYSDGGAVARHERRRGGGGGGLDRRRIGGGLNLGADERSPRFGNNDIGGGGRKRTHRSNSRSRSPSLERRERSKNSPRRSGGGGGGGGGSPVDRHGHASTQQQQQQQHQLQHDAEKRQRCRDFDEKGYCVRGETCPWDHGINPVVFEGINNTALISMSLREYNPDAPDLWARGGAPGGSHAPGGINPFTGATRPGGGPPGLNFALEKGSNGAGSAADYSRAAGFRGGAPLMPFPFNPAAVATPLQRELIPIPVVDASGGGHHHNASSGLIVGGDISAATLLQHHPGGKRRYELEDAVAIADGPPSGGGSGPLPPPLPMSNMKRKMQPLNSRLGPPHRMQSMQMQQQQSNCSLELRKVPRGLNTIAHLNNHFAKFGKIVNIQISYDGDPEAAICTFSNHAEANVAYRSTEAVLNNRFIKVFWHAQQTSLDGESGGGGQNNASTGGRKNSQYHLNNVPAALPTPSADSAKTANISTSSAATPPTSQTSANTVSADGAAQTSVVTASHLTQPSLRLKNNVVGSGGGVAGGAAASNANIRKNQQEKAKAVVQLANGLRKRKQELLQSYVKQMKSALELVERSDAADPQRVHTLATIKILQETIDKLGKEIAAEQAEMQSQIQSQQAAAAAGHGGTGPPPAKKTKEQQKRELLDIELELFAQQQEGNDTSAIQRRLEELQRSLGIVSAGTAGAGGLTTSPAAKLLHHRVVMPGAVRGGGVPSSTPHSTFPDTRVDRRPKAIVVTGFTSEEADFVLGHFKHFGEITKHDVDKEIPQLILSYASRISAEQAVLRGKLFKDKRLQISWAPVIAQPAHAGVTAAATAAAAALAQSKAATLSDQNQAAAANVDAAAKLAATVAGVETPTTGGGAVEDKQQRISESEAMTASDTLPELRLEDEEEDEESEDRSWRR